jgi:hypothetical protein
MFQKEHLLLDLLTQNEIYTAVFTHGDCGKRARRQDLCLRRERGVGLNHSFFMNDQGQYHCGLLECPRMVGCGGRIQGKLSNRHESAHASSEGVIHWIDVIEFWFLLYCSSP